VARARVIAWRKDLEVRGLSLAERPAEALGALLAVRLPLRAHRSVRQPRRRREAAMANGNEGGTPALGDAQARKLLDLPLADTLKGVRDRAILATCSITECAVRELCGLRVRDMQSRQGVVHFRVRGKRGKIRFVSVHALAQRLIEEYRWSGR